MEINSIIEKLLIRYPLFGNVIVNLKFKLTKENVNAPAFTDGGNIFYKQEFIDEYSERDKEFIIAHEIFHIVLRHIFRNVGKDLDLLNFVEDAIINQLLVRDGLVIPDGGVDVEDALNYSVEELYMRFLPRLDEIKEWVNENTYHIEMTNLDDFVEKMFGDDVSDIMSQNSSIRSDILGDFKNELKNLAAGKWTNGEEVVLGDVGSSSPLVSWKELLRANLNSPEEVITLFYEVEMDGIIRREEKCDPSFAESEIIIDSSGSMNIEKLKIILCECKNILKDSELKVGFCDTKFYGFIDVHNKSDLDKISIRGRGGTNFGVMVESFSKNALNKIIITDGCSVFPKDDKGVFWIIMNYYLSPRLELHFKDKGNYMFINEDDVMATKRMILKK